MATRPEHAIASSWLISALPQPHPRHSASMPGEICVCVSISSSPLHLPRSMRWAALPGLPVLRASGRSPIFSPRRSGAPNKREPSADDCSAAPTVAGIHPGSSHAGSRCAFAASSPGSRNRDKSHGPGGRTVAPTQQEREPRLVRAAVLADQPLTERR